MPDVCPVNINAFDQSQVGLAEAVGAVADVDRAAGDNADVLIRRNAGAKQMDDAVVNARTGSSAWFRQDRQGRQAEDGKGKQCCCPLQGRKTGYQTVYVEGGVKQWLFSVLYRC